MGVDNITEVRKSGNLFFLINSFIGAYNRRTDVLAQASGGSQFPDLSLMAARLETIHGLVFELDRKVNEFMSTQEERLRNVQSALSGIADGINTLQQQVADLKANNPDLDDEISAIEGTVKTIADDINGVVPGGGTGGGTEPTPNPEG